LARNVIRRGTSSGKKNESEKDRWLLAKMTAPSSVTFSSPMTYGRKNNRRTGPKITFLRNQ
jgi:hypothetical protein